MNLVSRRAFVVGSLAAAAAVAIDRTFLRAADDSERQRGRAESKEFPSSNLPTQVKRRESSWRTRL